MASITLYANHVRQFSNGTTAVVGSYPIVRRTSHFPPTIRRKRPTDLFAQCTAREVDSETWTFDMLLDDWSRYGFIDSCPNSIYCSGDTALHTQLWDPSNGDWARLDGKIRKKIRDENVNLAQACAEYRQTSKMYVSLATDVVNTFHSLRSGRPLKDFMSLLKSPKTRADRRLANKWLEYQYGILPHLSDVHGAAEALAKNIQTGIQVFKSSNMTENYSGRNVATYYTTDLRIVRSMSIKARYEICDKSLKRLSELGITNPLLLTWELIPYSFVVDWLIPVGDYLSALDALSGVQNLVVNRGWRVQHDQVTVVKGGTIIGVSLQKFKRRKVGRLASSNTLQMPRLTYKPSIGTTRMLNALALIRQLKR